MADELGRAWNSLGRVHRGDLLQQPFAKKKKLDNMNPDKGGNQGLGVARVVAVDYEEHYVTLRTVIGTEQEFERVPVPLTYPGAGTRHFLGAMCEVGDYAVVGWLPQESSEKDGGSMTPVILTWVLPGVWPGRDWLALSNFTEDEHDGGSSRSKEELRGIFDRIRHKLRHIQPGNIVASSSQGSDLVLDEDVLLANRRGNEFMLRDADQAVVTRALQQFTALAGSRTYAGMVQRDALRLPTTMFSDGLVWDGPVQAYAGQPLHEVELPSSDSHPEGHLTPEPMLARSLLWVDQEKYPNLTKAFYEYPKHLDPYVFLRNGGYINEEGVAVDLQTNDAVYGGKNIYRVAAGTRENAALDTGIPILTEHRIEVAHTSDGRLPVTEQTDGFDAERLPGSDPSAPGGTGKKSYIEWVLGSVVGNEPFTARGRKEYGLPLVARVFDETGGLSPWVGPATIAAEGQGGGTPLAEHAATLFKLTPPTGEGLAPTWWSINKQGQARINISGPATGYGLDVAIAGGMRLAVGGGLELQLKGGIHFATLSKNSLRLRSEQGPVIIYGGGADRGAESTLERMHGTQGGESGAVPSVDIHARTNARVRAEKKLLLKGQQIESNAKVLAMLGHEMVEISSSKQVTVSTEDMKVAVGGKRTDTFTGPKMLLPTSGALHERSYTPNYPGVVSEEVTYEMGDREETFNLGNHSTKVLIGNMSYETELGTWKARALQNTIEIGAGGITADALAGDVKLNATAGSAVMKGTVSALIEGVGPTTIKSGATITLQSPGNANDIGPVLVAGTREPFTNLPFAIWGLGAKTVVVAS
jgi:hypothetical protein